jgi:3-hydroxyacyl-CoA dehydrogenase, C-terminal domain
VVEEYTLARRGAEVLWDVQPDQVGQPQRSHRVRQPGDHGLVDVFDGTLKLIADKMFDEVKEPQYGAPPLLVRMVDAGLLGKKSGQGFYTY